jgi:zinc protease
MKLNTHPAFRWISMLVLVISLQTQAAPAITVPVEYYKLPNGLKVVLSPDKHAPIVSVAVYYNIGFRIEPRDRTGFAHLFEHMMFQGSKNFPKGEFDKLTEKNGGFNNGSTRFDFTNYYEVMPAHMLEPILWAESDRMRALDLNQASLTNQQGVVKNEVKVNVINRPYGGFPWLDMPQYANENWYNAHNFYGDLKDLDAAKLEDVEKFFNTYYAPNNAVLVIVGDFDPATAKTWVQKYFSAIPSAQLPQRPDLTEPAQTKEKRFTKVDSLINKPAIAIAYKMPERNSPEYFAMGLISQLLVEGKDSRLSQRMVQQKGFTSSVNGGINYLGNMFNYNGPMLWMMDLIYDGVVNPDSIIHQLDGAIADIETGINPAMLQLAQVKMRSDLYDNLGSFYGIGLTDLLASFALFDDNPGRVNSLEQEFAKVTPELVKRTIRQYLKPENRTILIAQPAKK